MNKHPKNRDTMEYLLKVLHDFWHQEGYVSGYDDQYDDSTDEPFWSNVTHWAAPDNVAMGRVIRALNRILLRLDGSIDDDMCAMLVSNGYIFTQLDFHPVTQTLCGTLIYIHPDGKVDNMGLWITNTWLPWADLPFGGREV